KLPALARLHFVTRIYPSVRYALDTNESPAIIGADQMWATTGDRGDGVKIGIVDDGIDQTNPFFSPTGFGYPAGFPRGATAFTTPIVAAFESAVDDGIDVINFSGGGPEVDPLRDALVEAVRNVSNAGVVPVIAAGNDRDDWGLGSVGSPGTAPDAISVAAVS